MYTFVPSNGIYQLLEQSSAQESHDDDVEEISTIQHHSEDEGSAERGAENPVVLSRPPTSSQRG